MKTRFILSSLGFVVAMGILLTSLFTAASSYSASSEGTASQRHFTMNPGEEILPDHLLYPVKMITDRLQLESAPPQERIFLEMSYAHRRLQYAQDLLAKDPKKEDLAVTTLTKAEQYLHKAVREAHETQAPASVVQRIARAMEYHNKQMTELKPTLTDANRAVLDSWLEQNTHVISSLQ